MERYSEHSLVSGTIEVAMAHSFAQCVNGGPGRVEEVCGGKLRQRTEQACCGVSFEVGYPGRAGWEGRGAEAGWHGGM